MASCIIHVDGSSYPNPINKKQHGLGWGLLAEHNNKTHEATGGYTTLTHHGMIGAHEDIALLHALKYMRDNGFNPKDTHIYCDDDLLGHAPTYLAKENFCIRMAEKIEHRVKRAAQFIGHEQLVPLIMDELYNVRMYKVKGHQGHVYQERVNYLAKWRAHFVVGNIVKQETFNKWLKKGLRIYMAPKKETLLKTVGTQEKDLIALGLLDPPNSNTDTTELKSTMPYKPRVQTQYAPFVRTLCTAQEKIALNATYAAASETVSP